MASLHAPSLGALTITEERTMAVNETATEQTPREKAQEILDRQVKWRMDEIAAHSKHFDALILAIQVFGSDSDVSFNLGADEATVRFIVKDINTTLKSIHHQMRSIGWKAVSPFCKDYISWYWREDGKPMGSPEIVFRLDLADNATCRKVQVGTKEVPVFEIQCEKGEVEEPGDE